MKARTVVAAVVAGIVALGLWLWTPDRDRATLEARYATAPSEFLSVAGLRLHVRDTGPKAAPAIVLLHGWGSSLQTWDAWSRVLETDHRVIRFDIPGAGLTGIDPTGKYDDDRMVEVLNALLDTLRVPKATLIGNSMGGRMAWYFAVRSPSRVDKLVLISPDGFASPGFEYNKHPDVPAALSLMRYVLPRPLVRQGLLPAYADKSRLTDSVFNRYYDMLLAPGNRVAMLDRLKQAVLVDPVPLLNQVRAPTLLLWGVQDSLIPIRNAQDYLRVMPDARLVTLPNAGHVPHEEIPAESVAEVVKFLDQRPAA